MKEYEAEKVYYLLDFKEEEKLETVKVVKTGYETCSWVKQGTVSMVTRSRHPLVGGEYVVPLLGSVVITCPENI